MWIFWVRPFVRATLGTPTDYLLDLGFRKDMEKIVDCLPRQRQSLLLYATVPNTMSRHPFSIVRMPIQWHWKQSLLLVHSLPNLNPFQTHPTHYFMSIESFLRVHLCHYLWFHSTPPFIYNHSSHFLYLILCPITLPPCPFSYMHGPHGIF